jgi:hypothetical protein
VLKGYKGKDVEKDEENGKVCRSACGYARGILEGRSVSLVQAHGAMRQHLKLFLWMIVLLY